MSATCSSEALQLLKGVHVDLVLSDHYLQGEMGTEIAAKVKELKPELPVLIVSSSFDILDRAEHVDGFISKTAGPTNMLVSIARTLRL